MGETDEDESLAATEAVESAAPEASGRIRSVRTPGVRKTLILNRGEDIDRQVIDLSTRGASIEFRHGPDGQVIGYRLDKAYAIPHLSDKVSRIVSIESLNRMWPISREIARYRIDAGAKQVVAFREAIQEMARHGRGDSPEAAFLKGEISKTITRLNGRYGPVIR